MTNQPEIPEPVLRLLVGMVDAESGSTAFSVRLAVDGDFNSQPELIESWMLEVLTVAEEAIRSTKAKVEEALLMKQVVLGRARRKMADKLKMENTEENADLAEKPGERKH